MSALYEIIRRLLELLYGICGDYGIAIVWITVMIRICLMPLNHKQRKTLKKQQKLSEDAEKVKQKYRGNEAKMNQELQKIYRQEGAAGIGCLLSFLQFPIMLVLYNGIRRAAAVDVGTVLLPWIPSLLMRDVSYILPLITVFVQMLPQLMPYIGIFKNMNLQKMSKPMIVIMLLMNSWFACMLPAGIELYYMVSGVFTAAEQALYGCLSAE